ncbi:unnamed protein product [Onchocerca flexuosa]|uniref:Uncharacterized protein n=1 Tax=Onchocerca flexuosa TaxID=387005 RepID=A0A183HTG4_9BILA|nr:unnamed protein product [Onchocerca flexuosa]
MPLLHYAPYLFDRVNIQQYGVPVIMGTYFLKLN